MSGWGPSVTTTTRLRASRDERLVPYCIVAVGALAATLLTGDAALVGLALPFMLALAMGVQARGPVHVTARITLETEQVLEGDTVNGEIELGWERRLDARVIVHRPHGAPPPENPAGLRWELVGSQSDIRLRFRLLATRWGRHPAGELWVRLSTPTGLLVWTGRVATLPVLRVLPAGERLNRLLSPPEARAALGAHRSIRYGEGHEFADLRPYAPGDRLRSLNWRATARHRRPFVNRQHQEVSGDVVIVIDTFGDGSHASDAGIARAARAAWAIASVHLQANDRVGLASPGNATSWLPPQGGRRAKYRLFETLLSLQHPETTPLFPAGHRSSLLPPAALIIALSDLHDPRMLRLLQGWRARGRSVVVARVDTRDLLDPPATQEEAAAMRIWGLELERRRRDLAGLGIPVVPLMDGGPVAPVITALRRAGRVRKVRVAR